MITIGARVYGLGAIGLGGVTAAFGAISPDWLPVPAHTPLLVYGAAAWLVLGGLAINAQRTARAAALALAALFTLGMLVLEAPHTVAKPADWGGWQAIAESTAMVLGGVLAYAQMDRAHGTAVARIARLLFGACLLVFGGSHFVYLKLTASLVPAWLPPSQVLWAQATGAAQITAGLAVLTGVQARLAAILLTAMYAAFGLLVHLPSIIAAPTSADNWTENAINLLLTGAAWALAEGLNPATPPAPLGNGGTAGP